jgi:hypothetical protein
LYVKGCSMSRVTVVVGFAEALAAPEVSWSLVDNGFRVVAFSRKGRNSALSHSRYAEVHYITPPESDAAQSLADLHLLLAGPKGENGDEPVVLFPLDDAAVWLCSRIPLQPGFVLAGPRSDAVTLALDKYIQTRAASSAGFFVLPTKLAITAREVLEEGKHLPLMLRSAHPVALVEGRLRRGRNWICGSRGELEMAVREWREQMPLLVQPFVRGIGEGIFGLAMSEGVRAWSAHRRLRMMNPHGSGSSACASQPVPDELKRPAEQFIKQTEWRGLFMLELLRDHSGSAWFVEFNGRPWGSSALARRQGLEYPAWNVKLALDPYANVGKVFTNEAPVVCRHLGREFMYPLFVLRGPKSKALNHWPSFWRGLADVARFRRRDSIYNWRPDDPKVFFSDCYYTIRDQLFKSKH